MSAIRESIEKKGYIPLAFDGRGGISWKGERLEDFWMWNGQYTEYRGGVKHVQTVKVAELKEAALRYWRDGWVPLGGVEEEMLRRMERALREHGGLKSEGVNFPEGPFLKMPEPIPVEHLPAEARDHLGLPYGEKKKLVRKDSPPKKAIDAFRKTMRLSGRRRRMEVSCADGFTADTGCRTEPR